PWDISSNCCSAPPSVNLKWAKTGCCGSPRTYGVPAGMIRCGSYRIVKWLSGLRSPSSSSWKFEVKVIVAGLASPYRFCACIPLPPVGASSRNFEYRVRLVVDDLDDGGAAVPVVIVSGAGRAVQGAGAADVRQGGAVELDGRGGGAQQRDL